MAHLEKVPIYLSGAIRKELHDKPGFGFMRTPNMGNKVAPDQVWFADNGCYSSKGERNFDLDAYLAWLAKQNPATCLGATAPDKVGDAAETLRRSLPVLPMIRALGYKAAFVAQDGLENLDVPWGAFDVLFIGGSTDWKLSEHAYKLVLEAKRQGKTVHMGRVNSYRRLLYAAAIGCDSVDGTFLAFAPDTNLPKLEGWINQLQTLTQSTPLEA